MTNMAAHLVQRSLVCSASYCSALRFSASRAYPPSTSLCHLLCLKSSRSLCKFVSMSSHDERSVPVSNDFYCFEVLSIFAFSSFLKALVERAKYQVFALNALAHNVLLERLVIFAKVAGCALALGITSPSPKL